jgi:hypothetical protein
MHVVRGAFLALCMVGCGAAGPRAETPSAGDQVLLRVQTPVGTRYTVLSEVQISLGELGQMRARTQGDIVADAHDEIRGTTTFTYRMGEMTMLDPDGQPLRDPTAMSAMVTTATLGADGTPQAVDAGADASSPHETLRDRLGQMSLVTYAATPIAVGDRWTTTSRRDAFVVVLDCSTEHRLVGLRDGSEGRVAEIAWEEECASQPVPRTDEGRPGLLRASSSTTGSGAVLVSDALHGHWIARTVIVITFEEDGGTAHEISRNANTYEMAIGAPI